MARDSLAYSNTRQEEEEAHSRKTRDGMKIKRATRSTHGIVQLKRFEDVVDWSQLRQPSKASKRVKREVPQKEQQEEEVKVPQKGEKEVLEPKARQEVDSDVDSLVKHSLQPQTKGENLRASKGVAIRTNCRPRPRPVFRKVSQSLESTGPSAIASSESHKSNSTCEDESIHGSPKSSKTESKKEETTLAMLMEEHKKVEAALKSFGEMLKSYQEMESGRDRSSKARPDQEICEPSFVEDDSQVTPQSTVDVDQGSEAGMLNASPEEDQRMNSESPPPLAELCRRAFEKIKE